VAEVEAAVEVLVGEEDAAPTAVEGAAAAVALAGVAEAVINIVLRSLPSVFEFRSERERRR
jgi:hypothetical protein